MRKLNSALFLVGVCFLFVTNANAIGKVCSNFDIAFQNDADHDIKITKFEYYDFNKNKWKTENLLGADGSKKLDPGQTWTKRRDLEKVEDRDTQFKVTFQRIVDGTKFQKETLLSNRFRCVDRGDKTITFDNTASTDLVGNTCDNFNITFANETEDEIKVTKFEYFDASASKWKTENMFGVDGHQKINSGAQWTKQRDLEKIGGVNTEFRATFKRAIGGNKWQQEDKVTVPDVTCSHGGSETILIQDNEQADAQAIEFLHDAGSELGLAALAVRSRYPFLKNAQRSTTPKFIDAHTKNYGAGHADLQGYGVTMIAHHGHKPAPKFDKINYWRGELDQPTELFFQKGRNNKESEWNIIGMGYGLVFDPDNLPTLDADGTSYPFLIHEAGYHRLGDGGFDCADNGDLKTASWNSGLRIDSAGQMNVTRDDLKSRTSIRKKRHGRLWTIHVWFDPESGLPVVRNKDPWSRQGSDAIKVDDCAFYFQ